MRYLLIVILFLAGCSSGKTSRLKKEHIKKLDLLTKSGYCQMGYLTALRDYNTRIDSIEKMVKRAETFCTKYVKEIEIHE